MAGEFSSLRALVEARALSAGDRPYLAAPDEDRVVTFADLARRSRALSALLAAHGVGKGGHVAYLAPNGADAVSLFAGTMAAGAVVTPLSLLATAEQLAYIIGHSDCQLLFAAPEKEATAREAVRLSGRSLSVLVTAPGWLDGSVQAGWAVDAPDRGDDALLMYTSGTTGRPKGVRLTHGNLLAGGSFVGDAHALGPDDRVLAVLPLYHINAQVVTVIAPLLTGGSLVMPTRFSAGEFWPLASRHRCTWLNLVPTIIAYLLNGRDAARAGLDLSGLRFCRSASAPLSPEHHRAFEARFGIGIVETMGLTETAAPVFSNPLAAAERKIGSPGRPFGNEARVVDPLSGVPLAADLAGEIEIRGPNVMKGYLKDEGETGRVLAADGWLKTGDLGYRDRDGFYFVTGRLKELIIKGGENIAPREIDEALLRHPALLEAAAVGVPDPFYGQEIEAGVVLRPGAEVSEEDLRVFCRDLLGPFKTPRAVRFLSELPKGPSGKVQRLRLLPAEGAGPESPLPSGSDVRSQP